eukprot:44046_1
MFLFSGFTLIWGCITEHCISSHLLFRARMIDLCVDPKPNRPCRTDLCIDATHTGTVTLAVHCYPTFHPPSYWLCILLIHIHILLMSTCHLFIGCLFILIAIYCNFNHNLKSYHSSFDHQDTCQAQSHPSRSAYTAYQTVQTPSLCTGIPIDYSSQPLHSLSKSPPTKYQCINHRFYIVWIANHSGSFKHNKECKENN